MGESKVDISYIDSGYIWSRNFMESFLKFLSSIKKEIEGVSEKAFIDMEIEIINAYRELQLNIKDLNLIMNCRTKGDDNSNFGGLQCCSFASKIVNSINKYFKNSDYIKSSNDDDPGSECENDRRELYHALQKIKQKALIDKKYAFNFECETRQKYLSYGKDDSKDIFENSGYTF